MRLSPDERRIIEEYIDAEIFNINGLINVIENNAVIPASVFGDNIFIKKYPSFICNDLLCQHLKTRNGYEEVKRETFLKRIPFYFYINRDDKDSIPIEGISKYLPLASENEESHSSSLEEMYEGLEFMFYELGMDLHTIFAYPAEQLYDTDGPDSDSISRITRNICCDMGLSTREFFFMWNDYLKICKTIGWQDYTPERFITKYNEALEYVGREPIIYSPLESYGCYFRREGNAYVCNGRFPCDKEGNPIMEWTSIKVSNPKTITYNGEKSQYGELRIELRPDTRILAYGMYAEKYDEPLDDEEKSTWHQIYAGPLLMQFDCTVLRYYREVNNLTQRQLAEAVGVSVRTYQKWEYGENVPDGFYLLRLMNWLDIRDTQVFIAYE